MYNGSPLPPPKVFVCCQPCREHRCGEACNHSEIDGREFHDPLPMEQFTHAGCMCVWAEKTIVRSELQG
jgi:hypothetical protein